MSKKSKNLLRKKLISLLLLVVLVLSTGIMPSTVERIFAGEGMLEEGAEVNGAMDHTIVYTVSPDSTVTAACSGECDAEEGHINQTLSIAASNQSYTGAEISKSDIVTLTGLNDFNTATEKTLSVEDVEFFAADDFTFTTTVTVEEVGSYVARLEVDTDTDISAGFSVSKDTASVTSAPTANTLTYDGTAQELITAGATSTGELQYKLGSDGTYSTEIPTATDAGSYSVYYKVVGDTTHADFEAPSPISVTIAKKAVDASKKSGTGTILAGYASSGSYDLPELETGMSYGEPATSSDTIITGLSISESVLNYSGTASVVSETDYTITVPVSGGAGCNYADYTFTLTLTGTACSHPTITHVTKVEATCTEDGVAAHNVCDTCGTKVDDLKAPKTDEELKIEKLGHNFEYSGSGTRLTALCDRSGCSTSYSITISATGTTYDGNPVAAVITDTDSAWANNVKALPSISYAKKEGGTYGSPIAGTPTDAGTYKASITEGAGTAEVEYAIAPITLTSSNVAVSGGPFEYTGTAITPTITVTAEVGGVSTTLTKDSDYTITGDASETDYGQYTFTVAGINNFAGSINMNWSIVKTAASISSAPTLVNTSFTYSEAGVTPITEGTGVTGGTLKYQVVKKGQSPTTSAWSETIPKATAVDEYDAYYMITADSNHSDLEAVKIGSFAITKASQAKPAAPEASEVKATSITISIPDAGKGETKYAINTSSTAPTDEAAWKSSNRFTGLTKDSTYYIFVKYVGNTNYLEAVSDGTEVDTPDSSTVTLTGVTEKAGILDPGIKYDGSPVTKGELYSGTPKIPDSALTAGELALSYAGRNTTVYGPDATAPTDPGEYTLTLTLEDEENVGTYEIDFKITKGDKAAPTKLTGVKPSAVGLSDGKITGLKDDESYEYSTDNKATWTAVSAATEITGLAAGKVYVRFKEGELTLASEAFEVVIPEGPKPRGPESPSGLKGVAPSTKGGKDAKITGLSSSLIYEYSTDNGKTWKAVEEGSTEITGLKPGDVKVRVAETSTNAAGAVTVVTVPDKPSGTSGEVDKSSNVGPGVALDGVKLNTSIPNLMKVAYNDDTGKGIFTPEEIEDIKNGADASISLSVTSASAGANASEFEEKAEAALGEDVSSPYYIEITLTKTVGGVSNTVTDPGISLEVKVQLADELILNDKSVVRRYRIIREHDGEIKVLSGTYNSATRELSFKTDGFSEYAIVYADATVKMNSIVGAMEFDKLGDTYHLPVTVTPAKAEADVVVYSSSNPGVAIVDKLGVITAVSNGTALITTRLNNELGTKKVTAVTVAAGGESSGAETVVSAIYTVVKGDTLSKIAAKNGMTLKAIIALNPQIKNINKIFPGQQINVKKDSPAATKVTSTATTSKDGKKLTEYVVKKNDTLSKIAKMYNMLLSEVAQLNDWIKNLHWIYPGQTIKVYNQNQAK